MQPFLRTTLLAALTVAAAATVTAAAGTDSAAGGLGSADSKAAADMPGCSMHADHMAAQNTAADIDQRGDRTMGFDHARTSHHFRLTAEGGAIEVETDDPADAASRGQIRRHLAEVARAFQQGDFAMPRAIHDRVLPGVPEMTRLKDVIAYRYEETARGGRVAITTADPAALAALHEFLKAQIADHRTGDSLAPASGH